MPEDKPMYVVKGSEGAFEGVNNKSLLGKRRRNLDQDEYQQDAEKRVATDNDNEDYVYTGGLSYMNNADLDSENSDQKSNEEEE